MGYLRYRWSGHPMMCLLALALAGDVAAAPQPRTKAEDFERIKSATRTTSLGRVNLSDEALAGTYVLLDRTYEPGTNDTIREFWKLEGRILVDCNYEGKNVVDEPSRMFLLPEGREIDDYPELQFKNRILALCVLKPMRIDLSGFPKMRKGAEVKVMPELVAIVDKDDYLALQRKREQPFIDYANQKREERLAKERAEKERQQEARRRLAAAKSQFDQTWAKRKWTTPSRRLQGSWQGSFGGTVAIINASGKGVYGSFGGDQGRWRQAGVYLDWQSNNGTNTRFQLTVSDDGKSLTLDRYNEFGANFETLTFFRR